MYKPTVVFDFDGVIHDYTGWKGETVIDGKPIAGIETILNMFTGYRLVIVSSRAINPDGKQAILDWLTYYKLDKYFDDITAIKVPAIMYIDDRAIRFTGNIDNDKETLSKYIPKKEALVLIGLPGSGKSTYAETFRQYGYKIISSDSIRRQLGYLTDMSRNAEVFDLFYSELREQSKRHSVIVDATNLLVEYRSRVIRELQSNYIKAVYFDISLSDILERNRKRQDKVPVDTIIKMYNTMERPDISEGFNEVIVVN